VFIVLGTDDNAHAGLSTQTGMGFLLALFDGKTNHEGTGNAATFDGAPIHFSAYGNGTYLDWEAEDGDAPGDNTRAWRLAFERGHELGNHTMNHPHGIDASYGEWEAEISDCTARIILPFDEATAHLSSVGVGISASELKGFRAPYLEYNDALFDVLADLGFLYDCSIEEGYQEGRDGTNYYWPYRLDGGSPGDVRIGAHPGIWEVPVYPFLAPPDDRCASYGVAPGLREKLAAAPGYLDNDLDNAFLHAGDGRLRGLDYDVWNDYDMTAAEALAVFKYSLDQRLAGNRAPMTLCMHVALYAIDSWGSIENTTSEERIQVVTDFIEYARAIPEVRIVSAAQLLSWLENPVAL